MRFCVATAAAKRGRALRPTRSGLQRSVQQTLASPFTAFFGDEVAGALLVQHSNQCDAVQSSVGLAVAATVETVPGGLATGCGNRRRPAERRECGFAAQGTAPGSALTSPRRTRSGSTRSNGSSPTSPPICSNAATRPSKPTFANGSRAGTKIRSHSSGPSPRNRSSSPSADFYSELPAQGTRRIEARYNRCRRHASIGRVSPANFELQDSRQIADAQKAA